ncbi:hypothetical protein [Legionella feeleii]|uniref:Uncharacterized protein n=1 Tax=Legionella feeleii TaxID=453 RepID=A0A0W0TUY0_9GAMM|nr:hypothetical protein [Legionella feeleii]KTC99286.1 hypothetical protein Lfee_1452 [Legionella feeleii]
MPFDQLPNLPTDDDPPAYDSIIEAPQDIATKKQEVIRAENEFLTQEITLLQQEIRRLNRARDKQKKHIELIEEQLRLGNIRGEYQQTKITALEENNELLQRKNSGLVELLEVSVKEQEQTLEYAEALELCGASMSTSAEVNDLHLKLQELEHSLERHRGEVSSEIEKQINEKTQRLQKDILDLFNQLLNGEAFSNLVSELEIKFMAILRHEQERFQAELAAQIPVQDELIQEYLDGKTQKLADLKKIHNDEKTSLFYNTSYIVLWAKIIGVISIFSQLVEKKAGLGEKAVELSSSVVGSLLGSVPVVGSLLDTIASFTLKEIGSTVLGHFEDKRTQNILEILRNPDHAKKMAELFARSLTLRYQAEIQSWEPDTIKKTATMYSDQVFELSIGGKIKECKDESTEGQVATFLGALQEATPRSKSAAHPQKSVHTQVRESTQTLRGKFQKAEYHTVHAITALKSEVAALRKEHAQQKEDIESLKTFTYGLQEIIAGLLTPPPTKTVGEASDTKPAGRSVFFSKPDNNKGAVKVNASKTRNQLT